MNLTTTLFLASVAFTAQAQAQSQPQPQPPSMPTSGTVVIVPAYGEVTHVNDQVIATFAIEEQDKDKQAAASRVNQKMKQGVAIVKQADPQAALKTQGYYTYAVYPEQRPQADGSAPKARVATAWRVGQYLQLTTTNLAALPKTVASAQTLLNLNGLQFGLSPATSKKLDDARIAATYQNLNERMSSIAVAMGRSVGDAVLDTVDFEGSGAYAQQDGVAAAPMMRSAMMKTESAQIAEPSFEPGETTLQMRLVGTVKFR
jgi:predicted secreted protein